MRRCALCKRAALLAPSQQGQLRACVNARARKLAPKERRVNAGQVSHLLGQRAVVLAWAAEGKRCMAWAQRANSSAAGVDTRHEWCFLWKAQPVAAWRHLFKSAAAAACQQAQGICHMPKRAAAGTMLGLA